MFSLDQGEHLSLRENNFCRCIICCHSLVAVYIGIQVCMQGLKKLTWKLCLLTLDGKVILMKLTCMWLKPRKICWCLNCAMRKRQEMEGESGMCNLTREVWDLKIIQLWIRSIQNLEFLCIFSNILVLSEFMQCLLAFKIWVLYLRWFCHDWVLLYVWMNEWSVCSVNCYRLAVCIYCIIIDSLSTTLKPVKCGQSFWLNTK